MSRELTREIGQPELYEMSARIDDLMQSKKGLLPNVDFYSATVYHSLQIPVDLFTPVFAMSRVAGWCAHVFEQYENNRIYRPRGRYAGPDRPRVRADRPPQPEQTRDAQAGRDHEQHGVARQLGAEGCGRAASRRRRRSPPPARSPG